MLSSMVAKSPSVPKELPWWALELQGYLCLGMDGGVEVEAGNGNGELF